MLREVKNAGWERVGFIWRRHIFVAGQVRGTTRVKPAIFEAMEAAQRTSALPVLSGPKGRTYWWCLDRFFWEDEGLAAQDVFALAFERQVRAERKLQRAHATVAAGTVPQSRRDPIPIDVRQAVYERDGGRCVICEAGFDLQYDHVIPVALGGGNSVENLQLLCGTCNRAKGATLG